VLSRQAWDDLTDFSKSMRSAGTIPVSKKALFLLGFTSRMKIPAMNDKTKFYLWYRSFPQNSLNLLLFWSTFSFISVFQPGVIRSGYSKMRGPPWKIVKSQVNLLRIITHS
jgi:hypothetical protein